MCSRTERQGQMEPASYKELQVLTEIESNSDITQRQLSQRVGIALGLTNALLRSLIKKGYVRSQQASWKRWVYSLTPTGAAHKIRLTVGYIHRFLENYQGVRQTLRDQLEPLALHEESRIAIIGTGEFAELVYLGLIEIGISEINIFGGPSADSGFFLGMQIRDINVLDPNDYDRILAADLSNPLRQISTIDIDEDKLATKLVTFFKQPYQQGGS